MKKYFILSAAALALASCSNDEFLGTGTGQGPSGTSGVIGFAGETLRPTRAESTGAEAANKLGGNFIVYGFKYAASEDLATASNDKVVFDLYNVNYTEGSDNTTESNTKGWEYVGYDAHPGSTATETKQSIKYWDYSADGYVFSAVSGTGITAAKTTTGATVYDKGWTVTIPAGGDLSTLYASDRVPVAKTAFNNEVKLTFYSLATKIRFGFYESVPGYSIQIKKFYYNSDNSTTNFGVDGKFKMLSTTEDARLTVTYYDNAVASVENRPKVSVTTPSSAAGYGEFGANIQATEKLGTASNNPTWDQAEGVYTYILPYNNTDGMSLKVDYTLTSTDGSGEVINVTGATAKVPSNFTNWKENFAYTYLFKISDNTNGYTGTTSNPAGLYPITFDAVVVDAEDGIQETITSVSDPSITTYQKGIVVTDKDEYKAGDIYFENDTKDISNYHVYEVNNYGTEATTEEVVANWKNNFCVLTEVDVEKADGTTNDGKFIPLSDDTYLVKAANEAAKFTAVAGKTYVIVSGEAKDLDPTASKAQCKVVKVADGPAAAPTYTLYTDDLAGSATTLTLGGFDSSDQANPTTGKLYLAGNGVGVLGAMPLFTITPDVTGNNGLVIVDGSNAGVYDLSINSAAVNAGTAKGDYTVKFNNGATVTITIGTTNKLWDNAATPAALSAAAVTAGGSAVTAVLKIDGTAKNTGVIVNDYEDKGVVVTNTSASGEYTIEANQNAVPDVYDIKIAGETVTVTVTNYAFAKAAYEYTLTTGSTLVPATGTPATIVLNVLAGDAAAATSTIAAANVDVTGANLTLAGNGTFTPSAAYSAAGGEHTLTYANTAAEATVIVNKYAIENGTIARSTGRVELGVTVNDKAVNASAAKVKITKNGTDPLEDVTSSFTISANGQKIVISGAKSTLATGAYTVHYYLETGKTNEVATSALTVN